MSNHKNMGISFYMQKVNSRGDVLDGAIIKDLEIDFDGLLYSKADGLEKLGKLRSYSETYSDSERLRVYIPNNQTYEPSDVTFTFLFTGDNKMETYYKFVEYVTKGFHSFWDTKRKKKIIFYVPEEISPNDIKNKGNAENQYIELNLKVKNIFGKTFNV